MDTERPILIVLAALLHDSGKLLERGNVFPEARKDDIYLSMCPQAWDGPYHTHLHAAHTRKFCDWLEERFACLRDLPDKSWKDWCGGHHRNDESGLESSVIRIADRLSSSEKGRRGLLSKGHTVEDPAGACLGAGKPGRQSGQSVHPLSIPFAPSKHEPGQSLSLFGKRP